MPKGKGLPSIRQRKDKNGNKLDVWEAQINLGKDPATGKTKRIAIYGKTSAECRAKLIDALGAVQNQTFVEPNKITVAKWLDTWLEEYKKANIRPTTYSSYEYIIRCHLKTGLGSVCLKDLRPEQVQKFYNEKTASGLSARTVKYIHTVLHEALEQAVLNNIVMRNVTNATVLPKGQKKEMRVLSIKEQEKFMTACSEDSFGFLLKFDLSTGLRRGEILALRWKDVDMKEGVIHIRQAVSRVKTNFAEGSGEPKTTIDYQAPKTEKGKRSIPLSNNILAELKRHREGQREARKKLGLSELYDGLVFTNEIGGGIEPRNLNRRFYELVKKAGIPHANLHCLRHTFATRCLEKGIDAKIVQEFLGHSSITLTLDIYTHLMPETKREAMNKMNDLFEVK